MKIDVVRWEEFKIESLFDVINSKPYHKKDVTKVSNDCDDKINYITRSKYNNGLLYRVHMDNKFIVNPSGTISFGAENADFFLQDKPYITGNKMYYIDTSSLTKNQSLFLKAVLQTTLKQKYGYNDGLTGARLKKETIFLPSKNGEPDWQYMEDFIANRERIVKEKIENFKNIKKKSSQISIEGWKEYKVGELFKIQPTKNHGLTNKDLFDDFGTTPVVVNSSYNNGIGGMTDLKPTEIAPKITFSDTTNADSIFLQTSDFAGYSHVQGLNPIDYKDKWNTKTLLYFCIVFKTKALTMWYNYTNKFTRTSAELIDIKLPIKNNEPDWEYMEQYIDKKQKEAKEKLELLRR